MELHQAKISLPGRLLSISDENNQQVLSQDEIVHNVMLVMVAGHDTPILITFMVRILENHSHIFASVLQGSNESFYVNSL